MQIERNEFYIQLDGCDDQGEFLIRIYKDGSQIQVKSGNEEAYIDVNFRQMQIIRDAFTEVIYAPEETTESPKKRVRWFPADTDETFDGTVITEEKHCYVVAPDQNLQLTQRWNKKYCEIIK